MTNHSEPGLAGMDLGLSDRNGGCACGDSHARGAASHAEAAAPAATAATVTTQIGVIGMTCSHCVASVTEELNELDGVDGVQVRLEVGGVSAVTIASREPLSPEAIRAAIAEAGYELEER